MAREEKQRCAAKSVASASAINLWSINGQPVPKRLKPLPEADLLRRIESIKSAALNRLQEFSEVVVESVEDHIQSGASCTRSNGWIPDFHRLIVFEYRFDSKLFSNKIRKFP